MFNTKNELHSVGKCLSALYFVAYCNYKVNFANLISWALWRFIWIL